MKKNMKKGMAVLISASLAVAAAGCGKTADNTIGQAQSATDVVVQNTVPTEENTTSTETQSTAEETSESADVATEAASENGDVASYTESTGVMTYADYMAAEIDTQVIVETYVQAKQSWWEDKATVYTQDMDGAYFLYEMACSQEDYEKLVPGTKIRVTGYKSEWSGEVEIIDSTFEIIEGDTYIAQAEDVTSLLGSEELIAHQNKFVSFKGMTVEDAGDGAAYLYKWDGSGSDGDDLYFNVSLDGTTYTFTVESYLCDNTTDVYNAVKNLQVGDVVDMEGFLYWYEGVNPHITSVTVE